MSNILFANSQGQMIAVEEAGAPALLQISLGGGASPFTGFTAMKSIITRVAMSQSPNVSLRHMVGNAVHISVFGDKIGPATITGLSAGAQCEAEGEAKLGIEHVAAYYEANKASAQEDPIKLTIGTTSYKGYLIGFSADVADPKTNIWQFTLNMVLVPKKPKWKEAEPETTPISTPAPPTKPPSAFPPTGSPNDPLKSFPVPNSLSMDRAGGPQDYTFGVQSYGPSPTAGARQNLTQGFSLHA
jgi:hypothetical protein